MTTGLILILALVLDAIFGDPPYRFHPVRLMGALASLTERQIRKHASGRFAGVVGWLLVTTVSTALAIVVHCAAHNVHAVLGVGVDACLVYVAIAPRDLAQHARRVQQALAFGDLAQAQAAVGNIVGRDTDVLDASGVARAAVEAVAESTVDGVTAPLFWSAVFGPCGAILYRATNTLDSMWGHRDARYERFGFAAARLDDFANYLPARLSVFWISGAALLLRLRARDAWRAAWMHGKRHASPNSGLSEAAFAGALGLSLGGRNRYDGEWHDGPVFGFTDERVRSESIGHSIRLMWWTVAVATSSLFALLYLLSRVCAA